MAPLVGSGAVEKDRRLTRSRLLYGANVHANGIRQHVLRYGGSGPAVVVVPGITSPAATWGFVAERLAERLDVLVVDVRGRGLSASGPALDYGLDAQAADLLALVEALGLERPSVLGHSMGARIAIRAATLRPAMFAGLALVDPPVSGPGRRPYPAQLDWYLDSIRRAGQGIDAEAMRAFCPGWAEHHLRLRAEWLHTCHELAVVRSFDDFHAIDIIPELIALRTRATLILAGRGDVVMPEDEAEIRAARPDLPIRRVADAGHLIPWDDLEGFLAALDDVLLP